MTSTARPTCPATGSTLADASTAWLKSEYALGWRTLNGVDIAAELAWREAQDTVSEADAALFESIIDLEQTVRDNTASAVAGTTFAMRDRAKRRLPAARAALATAIDALTPDQMAAFGPWRVAFYA